MTPAIPVGSVVVILPIAPADVRVGDVITFQDPADPRLLITHRVTGISALGENRFFETKGDANTTTDLELVPSDFILGKVVLHIPLLGRIIQYVQRPIGFTVTVGVPFAIIIVGEVINIIQLIREGEGQSRLRRRGLALKGSLKDFSLLQVLHLITLGRRTGTLNITHNGSQATLVFQTGKLVHAAFGKDGGSLASVLEHVGWVRREQAVSLERHAARTSDKYIGLVLIERGYFTRFDIIQSFKRHALHVVNQLASWEEGTFTFEIDRLSENGHITVPIDLENAIIRIAQLRRLKGEMEEVVPSLGSSPKYAGQHKLSLSNLWHPRPSWVGKQVAHEANEA